jgi:hypothetical protein
MFVVAIFLNIVVVIRVIVAKSYHQFNSRKVSWPVRKGDHFWIGFEPGAATLVLQHRVGSERFTYCGTELKANARRMHCRNAILSQTFNRSM